MDKNFDLTKLLSSLRIFLSGISVALSWQPHCLVWTFALKHFFFNQGKLRKFNNVSLNRAWQYQCHVFKYCLQAAKSCQVIVSNGLKALFLKKYDFWRGGTHFDEFWSEMPSRNQEFSFFGCHLLKNQLFSRKMPSIY